MILVPMTTAEAEAIRSAAAAARHSDLYSGDLEPLEDVTERIGEQLDAVQRRVTAAARLVAAIDDSLASFRSSVAAVAEVLRPLLTEDPAVHKASGVVCGHTWTTHEPQECNRPAHQDGHHGADCIATITHTCATAPGHRLGHRCTCGEETPAGDS